MPSITYWTKHFSRQIYESMDERKLYVYRDKETRGWFYDEPRLGIEREPFIDGADLILDHLSKQWANADCMVIRFGEEGEHDPGCALFALDRVRCDEGERSATYKLRGTDIVGWLCPHLCDYFTSPPSVLFVAPSPVTLSGG